MQFLSNFIPINEHNALLITCAFNMANFGPEDRIQDTSGVIERLVCLL